MSQRRIETVEIMEGVRLLRMGESDRSVAGCLGHTRRTVGKCRAWAREQGLLAGELPEAGAVHRLLANTMPGLAPPLPLSRAAQGPLRHSPLRRRPQPQRRHALQPRELGMITWPAL